MFYSLRGPNENVVMHPEETCEVDVVDADAVMKFLSVNPDFFHNNQDLLARLRVPHVTGATVSLVEKQVSVLRSRCSRLEGSLRDLIGVARDNEALHGRLHGLIRDIVSARDVGEIMTLVGASLAANFSASDVRLLLLDNTARRRAATRLLPAHPQAAASAADKVDDATRAAFDTLFERGETVCGMPDARQLQLLVGDASSGVGSAALIPLAHEGRVGILMLASRDESRFASGKGVMFLDQLGEVLGRRLSVLGVKPS